MRRKNIKKGFTLLELLVVVLIIGILAAIALPQYQMAVMKSRYSTLMNNVKAMYEAEERYYLVNGEYAANFEGLDIDLSGCTLSLNKKTCNYDWGFCRIDLDSQPSRVHCENTKTLKNAYVRYLNGNYTGMGICWALTTDRTDKYNKLCENMGAKYKNQAGCTSGGCLIYQF